jgi:hypothetical protein
VQSRKPPAYILNANHSEVVLYFFWFLLLLFAWWYRYCSCPSPPLSHTCFIDQYICYLYRVWVLPVIGSITHGTFWLALLLGIHVTIAMWCKTILSDGYYRWASNVSNLTSCYKKLFTWQCSLVIPITNWPPLGMLYAARADRIAGFDKNSIEVEKNS